MITRTYIKSTLFLVNMKTVHLRVEANIEVTVPKGIIEKLGEKVALFTTAQLLHKYDEIAQQLESFGKEVVRIKTVHTREKGQLLGCNLQSFSDYTDEKFDSILYVGDGLFHPKALLWKNDVPSFMYDPFTNKEYEASKEDVTLIRKRYAVALSAFQMAKVVGVIIPLKPGGQMYLRWSLELSKIYPNKTFIYLVDYNVDFQGLENFPFCEVFVNAACPRIAFDDAKKVHKPVVNLEDVSESFYKKQLASVNVVMKK